MSGWDRASALRVLPDPASLAAAAADLFVASACEATRSRGRFAVALSGGATPAGMYRALAARARAADGELPEWDRVHVFWSDERAVPPDDAASNYGLAARLLLSAVRLPGANVHRIAGERPDLERAALAYEEEIRRFLATPPGEVPSFDLVFLGLGTDGHTASLFPGSPELAEKRRLVTATAANAAGVRRITFTLPMINRAARVAFLVSGPGKRNAMRALLDSAATGEPLPAALVRPRGELILMADAAAVPPELSFSVPR
jgi:6-phosphogluconolactonase